MIHNLLRLDPKRHAQQQQGNSTSHDDPQMEAVMSNKWRSKLSRKAPHVCVRSVRESLRSLYRSNTSLCVSPNPAVSIRTK